MEQFMSYHRIFFYATIENKSSLERGDPVGQSGFEAVDWYFGDDFVDKIC